VSAKASMTLPPSPRAILPARLSGWNEDQQRYHPPACAGMTTEWLAR
jgi:hypothetical protein